MLQAIRSKATASFNKAMGGVTAVPATALDAPSAAASRPVHQVMDEEHAVEGPGIEITRPVPTQQMRMFDPWLVVDSFGPQHLPAGHPGNSRTRHLGQHPHRGFQAITYLIEGAYYHFDSTGKQGRLEAGSVQLMTAGGGIVHGSAPTPEVERHGGNMDGYQLWLALPAAERMCPAWTEDFHAHETPTVTDASGAVWARVLASATPVLGATCTLLRTSQPIMMVHYVLQPGGVVRQEVPSRFSAMVHVNRGQGVFGPGLSCPARAEQSVFFAGPGIKSNGQDTPQQQQQGEGGMTLVEFGNPAGSPDPLDVLLLAGLPTNDKIVQYGPFVGGSQHDIAAARSDFKAGLMGALAPDGSPAPRTIWAADSTH